MVAWATGEEMIWILIVLREETALHPGAKRIDYGALGNTGRRGIPREASRLLLSVLAGLFFSPWYFFFFLSGRLFF